jgi:DNA transformation protein
MAVSASFKGFLLEQLNQILPVTSRAMFGGLGLYSDGLFFALADDDVLYFKADDTNRGDFERAGMGPFRPFGDERAMAYFEVPAELLEDEETLASWMAKALAVAARAAAAKKARPASPPKGGKKKKASKAIK